MAQPVKAGDTISVHYTGKMENGEVFDSSTGKEPLTFTVGAGQLIKGFDDAVVGMVEGEKKTVTIQPEEGYGSRVDERMIDMPRDNVPEGMDVQKGMAVQLNDANGNPVPAIVAEVNETSIRLDLNHPLAGKTLVFDISIHKNGVEPNTQCGTSSGCGSCCGGCDE